MPESLLQRLRYFLKINEDTKHYKIMHLLYFIYSEYVQLWVLQGAYSEGHYKRNDRIWLDKKQIEKWQD